MFFGSILMIGIRISAHNFGGGLFADFPDLLVTLQKRLNQRHSTAENFQEVSKA
jgi:hypothetical protein